MEYHQECYVCVHVFEESKPVLLVARPHGDWCFLCGDNHDQDTANFFLAGIGHVVDADQSIREVLNIEPNQEAERDSVDESWVVKEIPPEGLE